MLRLVIIHILHFGFGIDLESHSRRRMADFPLPSLPIAPLVASGEGSGR